MPASGAGRLGRSSAAAWERGAAAGPGAAAQQQGAARGSERLCPAAPLGLPVRLHRRPTACRVPFFCPSCPLSPFQAVLGAGALARNGRRAARHRAGRGAHRFGRPGAARPAVPRCGAPLLPLLLAATCCSGAHVLQRAEHQCACLLHGMAVRREAAGLELHRCSCCRGGSCCTLLSPGRSPRAPDGLRAAPPRQGAPAVAQAAWLPPCCAKQVGKYRQRKYIEARKTLKGLMEVRAAS